MEQIQGQNTDSISAENIVSLPNKKKTPTLKKMLKQEAELRGFFRYVHKYELRAKALQLIEEKLYTAH